MAAKHPNGVQRSDLYRIEPERLTIIGLDTDHKAGEHPLFDERALLPFDERAERMIDSIVTYGVKVAILAVRNGDAIEVVDGRQRVRCAREANKRLKASGSEALIKVPVIYQHGLSDGDLIGVTITTNEVRREDAVLTKVAKAARMLAYGKTRKEIAVAFGVTEQAVTNWIKISELHDSVKEAISEGKISAKAALQLADLKREEQPRVLSQIVATPAQAPAAAPIVPEWMRPRKASVLAEMPGTYEAPPVDAAPAPSVAVKKLTAKAVEAKIKGGEEALRPPTLRELKRLLKMAGDGELEATLAQDFITVSRVLLGELPVTKIAGLKSALEQLRGAE